MKRLSLYNNKPLWCIMLLFLSGVLSCFPILVLQDGGSWTFFSLLPLWLITYFFGRKTGLLCSFLFAFIKYFASIISEVDFSVIQKFSDLDNEFFKDIFSEKVISYGILQKLHISNHLCVFILEYLLACTFFCLGGFIISNIDSEKYITDVKNKRQQKLEHNKTIEKYERINLNAIHDDDSIAATSEVEEKILNNYIENYAPPLPTRVIVDINKENSYTGLTLGYLIGVVFMFVFYVISSYCFYKESLVGLPKPFNLDRLIYDLKYDGSYLLVEAVTTLALLQVPAVQKVIFNLKHIANNPRDEKSVHNF